MVRRFRLFGALLLIAIALGMALAPSVSAQDSTVSEVDYSPNPEQCNQAPRTIEDIESFLASATPAPTLDTRAPDDFQLPGGEEAPNEVRGGIVETIVQIIACANGGDLLASYGGMTDAWFYALLASGAFGDDPVTSLAASPVALPEEAQMELLDTREFTLYDDGRTGVLVYFRIPSGDASVEDPVQIGLWIFEQSDGRWLLDEMVSGLEDQLGDVATPPAG